MTLKKVLLLGLLTSQLGFVNNALAYESRAHDAISPMQFGAGNIAKRYLPKFHRASGCYPYTAVDKNGKYNGGLKAAGGSSDKCRSQDKQQVYARGKKVNETTSAIMYSYYFPKDGGYPVAEIGHRHDWENVIVFVKNVNSKYNAKTEKIVGAAYSAHGGISTTTKPNKSSTHIYVNYAYHKSVTHSMKEGTEGSFSKMVLIDWSHLPALSKKTLNNQSFGKAGVPFKDQGNRFDNKIEEARKALGIAGFKK